MNPIGHKGDLLMLVHRVPYPPDKGDKIRSFNELRFLAEKGWNIHLCALADDPADLAHVDVLRKYCASVSIEPINPRVQKLKSLVSLLSWLPLSAGYFYSAKLQSAVNNVLACQPIKAVFCFCGPMAEYLYRAQNNPLVPGQKRRTCVMDLVDVDSDKWRQYAQTHTWPMSWVYRLESHLLQRYERRVAERFDATVLVSAAEAESFHRATGLDAKVHPVANGVDLDYFRPGQTPESDDTLRITFCGAMDYFPNVDAVTWFAREVLPLVRAQLGDVEFCIVGGGAGADVRMLAGLPGVKVTGRVDDVRPYVQKASLSVAPIRVARGIQNKVLEALAMGKAVVATPEAFEGIEVSSERDLVVMPAEPEPFAAAVLELLRDARARRAMGALARKAVEEKYRWETRLVPLDEYLSVAFHAAESERGIA